MNFREMVRGLLPKRSRDRTGGSRSPSLVLLLRESNWPAAEVLRHAAESAFGITISGAEECPHFVMHSQEKAVIRAAPHMFTVMDAARPYFDRDPNEYAASFPENSQQNAWREHSAWLAINCIDGSGDVELEYCVLAKFAAEMLNSNCTGIWVPGEASLLPNNDALYGDLQKRAAARELGIVA